MRCQSCDHHVRTGSRFCDRCGQRLEPLSPQIPNQEPERRQLTILFCDMVDSTELSARMDPEDLRPVMSAYVDACGTAIAEFDGYIAQTQGDGLLVYFGYPQAHEDDAQRAVRAGLRILEAVDALHKRLRQELAVSISVRVGIHTGLVVAGEMGGSDTRADMAIVGEAPNIAFRLTSLAEPDTLLIGPVTHDLTRGLFDCLDLASHRLRGIARDIQVWRVIGARVPGSRFEATAQADSTPLVGRESETALLLDRWNQARAGHGQVVLLSGEAGIGKSRLVRVLCGEISEQHTRLWYQCSPYFTNTPLYPVRVQLEKAARVEAGDSPKTKLRKLEELLGISGQNLGADLPHFADLLEIPLPDDSPTVLESAARRKSKLLRALTAQLKGLSARSPVLLIMEDVHWSDPSTLEGIQTLIDEISTDRVLLLITHRKEFQPPWHSGGNLYSLTLNRLSRAESERITQHVALGKPLPRRVVDDVITKADGVPLFLEELTRTILGSGVLTEEPDRYVLPGPLPPLAIPATIHDSLMARLDRLASAKGVAQIGAAIGREFSYRLIALVSGIESRTLTTALRRLENAELIQRTERGTDVVYSFRHALLHDAAYQSLLRSRRKELHRTIAGVLEEHFSSVVANQPETLARHLTSAGQDEQAIPYWLSAGVEAQRRSSSREAIGHLSSGLSLLESLPASAARDGLEVEFLSILALAHMAVEGWSGGRVSESYARALELCRRSGEIEKQFELLWGFWAVEVVKADIDASLELAKDYIQLAQEARDLSGELMAHSTALMSYFCLGKFEQAHHHAARIHEAYDWEEHRDLVGIFNHDPEAFAWMHEANWLWVQGFPDQAREASERSIAHARRLGHPFQLSYALIVGASSYLHRGELAEHVGRVEEGIEISERYGIQVFQTFGPLWMASGMFEQEPTVETLSRLRTCLNVMLDNGIFLHVPLYEILIAQAHDRLGRTTEARQLAQEAAEHAQRTGERWVQPEIERVRGALLLSGPSPDPKAAEAHFRSALEMADKMGALGWELRAATSLTKLWISQGKRDDARALLRPIYGRFTEGKNTRDLIEAAELLATPL